MKLKHLIATLIATVALSACDQWAEDLEHVADAVEQHTEGEVSAWLLSEEVLVISVTNAKNFLAEQDELEAEANAIADHAVRLTDKPLESLVISFYAGGISSDPEQQREFIYLLSNGRLELQSNLMFDATGPLTLEEMKATVGATLEDYQSPEQQQCVYDRMAALAVSAGDPEALDPATIDYLPETSWGQLDAFGRRMILTQAIVTEALFDCV